MSRTLTAALLFRLWQREAALLDEADPLRPLVDRYLRGHCLTSAMADSMEAAQRVVKRADAFCATMARLNETADYDLVSEADRLMHMERWPAQHSVEDLLAERVALGVTVEWCQRWGRKAA